MDFNFTDEQNMLRDTVAKFVQNQYDFDTRRAIVKSADGWRADCWKVMAEELGILGAPFSEDHGGLGGGAVDNMIVMEEFGKGLVIEPYLGTVVLGGGFLKHGGGEQAGELIGSIIEGKAVFAFAYAEPQGRYNLADLTTTAKKDGAGFVLNGRKAVVVGASWATHLVVTARTSGGQRDRGGVSVFVVPTSAAGVTRRDYPTVDGLRASEVQFDNVKLGADALIGALDGGLPLVEQVTDEAIAALCAEAVGAMRTAHSVSMTYMATLKLDEPAEERAKAASAAKVQIGKACKFVGQSAIQIHGGMGMTDELAVGHYFKRCTMIEGLFGSVDHHLKRYEALSLPDAA
eukprot:gene15865-16028_t